MCPQIACLRRDKVTLVAFVGLFSTVYFRMSPQIACPRRCKVTLAAFVWFFSTVRFQMRTQISCLRWCIVTLGAFVWLFSAMLFKMTSQAAFHRGWKLTFVALVWFFSFIISVSQWKIFIDPTFTKVIYKISIHHHQVANVVSCVLSVPNWENVNKKRGGVSALARMVWGNF